MQAALLLGFAFGMALCGVQQAAADRHFVWMGGFVLGAAVMAVLYWWVALAWVKSIA